MTAREVARAYIEMEQNEHTGEILNAVKKNMDNNEFLDEIVEIAAERNKND